MLSDEDKPDSDGSNVVHLVFTADGEHLTGAAIVPKVMNTTAAGESRLNLIEPKFDGQVLTFRINDQGVMIANLKLTGTEFVGTYQIENSDEKGNLKLISKK